MEYVKNVWFFSGIYYYYSNDKFKFGFFQVYFSELVEVISVEINDEVLQVMFDFEIDVIKIDQGEGKDIVKFFVVNFYDLDIF